MLLVGAIFIGTIVISPTVAIISVRKKMNDKNKLKPIRKIVEVEPDLIFTCNNEFDLSILHVINKFDSLHIMFKTIQEHLTDTKCLVESLAEQMLDTSSKIKDIYCRPKKPTCES